MRIRVLLSMCSRQARSVLLKPGRSLAMLCLLLYLSPQLVCVRAHTHARPVARGD